jgi:uncharacterized repeat protein (TIGR01451 family)
MRQIGVRGSLLAAVAACALALAPAVLAAGTAPGTVISNQASVSYQDVNGNPLTALSNVVTTTVSQLAVITVDPDHASNADPGDVLYYAHTVTNGGNDDDTIDLAVASSAGWTVELVHDLNGNGLFDAGEPLLTDSSGNSVPDSGVLAPDASMSILVRVTVPAAAADGAVDTTVVTGTSLFDPSETDTATDVTTIEAPVLAVVKSVLPAGDQPPGTTLTYTLVVTNGGTGAANSIVLTDGVPTNTTYVAGSITQDAATRTDAADADNADHNATNAGAVTVSVGTLAAGGTTTITFQVTID